MINGRILFNVNKTKANAATKAKVINIEKKKLNFPIGVFHVGNRKERNVNKLNDMTAEKALLRK